MDEPKRKGGRPFLSAEPTVKIEITLPASLRDKLDGITDNRSAWVRQAIEQAGEPAKEGKAMEQYIEAAGWWHGAAKIKGSILEPYCALNSEAATRNALATLHEGHEVTPSSALLIAALQRRNR